MKAHRTADCVVVGVRWKGKPSRLATILLGLYGEEGELHYVGSAAVAASKHDEIAERVLPLLDETSERRFSEPNRWGTGELEETPLQSGARRGGALRQGPGPAAPPRHQAVAVPGRQGAGRLHVARAPAAARPERADGRVAAGVNEDEDAFGRALLDWAEGGPGDSVVERDDGFVSMSAEATSTARRSAAGSRTSAAAYGSPAAACSTWAVGPGAWRSTFSRAAWTWSVSTSRPSRSRPLGVAASATHACSRSRTSTADRGVRDDRPLRQQPRPALEPHEGAAALATAPRRDDARGRILAGSMDVTSTDDPEHLAYQERNVRRGRLPGQIRLRVRYRRLVGPWLDWLFVSKAELEEIVAGTRLARRPRGRRARRPVRRRAREGLGTPCPARARCCASSLRRLPDRRRSRRSEAPALPGQIVAEVLGRCALRAGRRVGGSPSPRVPGHAGGAGR